MRTALVAAAASLALVACNPASEPAPAHAADSSAPAPAPTAPAVQADLRPEAESELDVRHLSRLPDVAERVVESVVNIQATRAMSRERSMPPGGLPFFGPPGMHPGVPHGNSMGSGVIVRSDGIVLTNNHVIDGADEVEVTLHDGSTQAAEVVGADPKSDLAVLRLQDVPSDLPAVPLGDSDDLRLGEVVLAVGNPLGVGQTVTMGIVSAKGRALGLADYEDFIQTDAAINPGNSGGAMVDLDGELVGINTAIASRDGGNQGIGFAIPSEMAADIMQQLLDDGVVDRGWLGVMIQDLEPELSGAMGIEATSGVLVGDVVEGSPAEAAGLQRGDVIVSFNGEAMADARNLRLSVAGEQPETAFQVEVLRDGRTRRLKGTLGTLPTDDAVAQPGDSDALDGLSVGPLTSELRQRLELPDRVDQGVVAMRVAPGSRAALMGVRQGDVILEVNRRPVQSVQEFSQALEQAGDRVLLLVYRDGGTLFLAGRG